MREYIYLIREREFIRLGEPVFKIGKTTQDPKKRMNGYPKGSEIILYLAVPNCDLCERKIIEEFKKRFQRRKDIGNEYFEGSEHEMRDLIYTLAIGEITRPSQGILKKIINWAWSSGTS